MSIEFTHPGAIIEQGPFPWQVLQRDADGFGHAKLSGRYIGPPGCVVEVRVASENDNSAVAGCDWQPARMGPDQSWDIDLRIPSGGLYSIETRLKMPNQPWKFAGDKIWHVAVGDLWVIAGQSNAVGYGHGMVHDPPALGVSVFSPNHEWRLATHPIADVTGTKHPASRDPAWTGVSPWLAFGKEIRNKTGVPIGLIPTALGGSFLHQWYVDEVQDAPLFANMLEIIDAAGGNITGVVWYQGESDTTSDELADSYLERFTAFCDRLRHRLGPIPIITAQLNRHSFEPQADGAARRWSVVREAQRRAPHQIDRLAVVPTLDLPLSDHIHTSATGNVILGQRFALAALGMVYGHDVAWKAVDVQCARFLDDTRKSIVLEFDPVVDFLTFVTSHPKDYTVEDDQGNVPISEVRVATASDGQEGKSVIVQLDRAAVGVTKIHQNYGYDPVSTLRDHLHRPVLAFYELLVEDAENATHA